MKYFIRFMALAGAILVLALLQIFHIPDAFTEVKAFRGAELPGAFFDPLIAKSLNEERGFTVALDGMKMRTGEDDLYMNLSLEPMARPALISDILSCGVHMYAEDDIRIERGESLVTMQLGSLNALFNDQNIMLSSSPVIQNNLLYLPLKDTAAFFGFSCTIESEGAKRKIALSSENAVPLKLPSSYDLRNEFRISPILDQGKETTCWAHASIGSFESALLPENAAELSVDDMIMNRGYSFKGTSGGDFSQALAYLLSWKGPVSRASQNEGAKPYHLQEAKIFTADDIDAIKLEIYRNGGVSSSVFIDSASTGSIYSSPFYNIKTNSYCYTGSEDPNHDIIMIGWDDGFEASKFNGKARGDGAFICQNSWGGDFGDNGVFYVSYYDSNIGAQAVSYSRIERADNYDIIHQSDICGWTGQIGYSGENVFAANVFTAQEDERLKAAGFYSLGKNTLYELYVVNDMKSVDDLSNRTPVASGKLDYEGYYTIAFDSPIDVSKGKTFAVILSITTPGVSQPMAVEYTSDRMEDAVDISDGTGYISANGLDWVSVEEQSKGNLCLKAYSDIRESGEEGED